MARQPKNARVHRKHELDQAVAMQLGISRKQVRDITTIFMDEIMNHLAHFEDVAIENFGTFHMADEKYTKEYTITATHLRGDTVEKKVLSPVRKHRRFRVYVKKSPIFQQRIVDLVGSKYLEDTDGKIRS